RLLGEALAHPKPRAVDLDPVEPRVGARQVEELEHAERAVLGGLDGLERANAVLVDQDQLAGRELSLQLGADQVERARLGGQDPLDLLAAAEEERTAHTA